MSCLGCQRCEDGPVVTLHDGRVVCNFCPDYKDECLARHMLAKPDKNARREFLEQWGKKHGEAARDKLAALARSIWSRRDRG